MLSPNDLASDIDDRVHDYLVARVPLIWVVNPERRTVRIHRQDGSVALRGESDELTGEEALPGFRCKVADFFGPGSKDASDRVNA